MWCKNVICWKKWCFLQLRLFALHIGPASTCPHYSRLISIQFFASKISGKKKKRRNLGENFLSLLQQYHHKPWPHLCPRTVAYAWCSLWLRFNILCPFSTASFSLHTCLVPPFIPLHFHLISGSLLQGAKASLLSALTDVSSIIILKAF